MVGWTIDDVVRYSKRKEKPVRIPKARYNPVIVAAYFKECGLPEAVLEHQFHPDRKWRFDFAWLQSRLALEVQGGIWTQGRHTRGVALLKEWEKLNESAAQGWRVLYCQPSDLCLVETVELIKRCLNRTYPPESPA